MKRYLKVLLSLISISTKRYLENRVNTFGVLISSVLNLIITLFLINVIFSYTKNLNGWSKPEVLFLLGLAKFVTTIFYIFIHRGVTFLSEYIRQGNLDILLLKPINSQFYVTFRITRTFEMVNLLTSSILIFYAFNQLRMETSFFSILILIFGLFSGLVIFYSIYFIIATFSIWIVNFYSLGSLYQMINSPLNFPTNVYNPKLSFLLTYILPIGLIVSLPTEMFLKQEYSLLIVEIIVATILFLSSILFWNFALKRYTSASS